MPPAKQQEFMEKHLKLQSEIKREWTAIQKAQGDASPPEVLLSMRTDLGKKLELYKRLNAILPAQKKLPAPTGAAPGPSSQPPPPVSTLPTSATNPGPSDPVPLAPESGQPPLPSSTAVAEPQNQNPSVPKPVLPPKESYPTEVVAQIHRLMQQQNQQGTCYGFPPFHSLTHL